MDLEAGFPLLTSTLTHLIALEEKVTSLAKDFKFWPKDFTPVRRAKYVRDSPQLKLPLK
ncbi:14743_t:CDS:2 [Entrophospora sp. SA101]|nr:14743_t:CDS:2 [Entrophospora sp. SA101]